jgi:mono/diheme cytochrome c family protein
MNDGAVLNGESDASLQKIIALGGSAVGKSAMMPPYGTSLTQDEINDLIAYMRVIAVPEYHRPSGKVHRTWRSKPL